MEIKGNRTLNLNVSAGQKDNVAPQRAKCVTGKPFAKCFSHIYHIMSSVRLVLLLPGGPKKSVHAAWRLFRPSSCCCRIWRREDLEDKIIVLAFINDHSNNADKNNVSTYLTGIQFP